MREMSIETLEGEQVEAECLSSFFNKVEVHSSEHVDETN